MKIRSDFVSNSSSCSFSVSDCSKAIKLLNKLGTEVDWTLQEDLEISIHFKTKDAKELYEFFHEEPYKELQPYYWDGKWCKPNPDPEADDQMSIELSQLINTDPKLFDKITLINFSCDDYKNVIKLVLSMLYQYFVNHKIECDKSDTEINWDENEGCKDNFLLNLAKEFNKKGK